MIVKKLVCVNKEELETVPAYRFNEGGYKPSTNEYLEIAKRLEKHIPYMKVIAMNPGFMAAYKIVAREWINNTEYKGVIKTGHHTFEIGEVIAIQILKFCNDVPDFVIEKEREIDGNRN